MDSNYNPPSAEPPFDPDKYTPPSAEPPASEPQIIDVSAKETPPTSGFDTVPENLAGQPAQPQGQGGASVPPVPPPPPPAKNGMSSTTRTVLIIVAVVLVILCCCCLLMLSFGTWLYNNGDRILDTLSTSLPTLLTRFA